MNRDRRKRISSAREKVMDVMLDIMYVTDSEKEALENLPEGIRCSEKGDEMEGYIDTLDEALDYLGDVESLLNEENFR